MRTSLFILVVLVSGAFAGLAYGVTNLAVVVPYLDQAIEIENQALFASGQIPDADQFQIEYESYRLWQKGGQVLAGVIFGISVSALFGIVFALSRRSLPGKNDLTRSVILAGIMWITLYVVPFLKYPPGLPGTGDSETLLVRSILYLSVIGISGFGALGFYRMSRRFEGNQKIASLAGYVILIAATFLIMPENPVGADSPADLLGGFQTASFLTIAVFWVSVGVIMGLFWLRLRPDAQRTRQYE